MDNLSKNALLLKKVFQAVDQSMILDIIAAPPDALKVPLRDGRTLLARLDRDGSLRLDEIDEVC